MLLVLLGVCADTYVKIKRLEVEREAIEHGIPITITPEKP
jgi:hypothetical protein